MFNSDELRQVKARLAKATSSADVLWKILEDRHMEEMVHMADTDPGLTGLIAELVVFEISKRRWERIKDSLEDGRDCT